MTDHQHGFNCIDGAGNLTCAVPSTPARREVADSGSAHNIAQVAAARARDEAGLPFVTSELAPATLKRVSRAKKFNGTCPCCFGSFAVGAYMVLHGYTRPGFGYIQGACPASTRFPPYETSNEGTRHMLGLIQTALASAEHALARARTATFITTKKFRPPAGYYNLDRFGKATLERDAAHYITETIKQGERDWERRHRALVVNAENTVKHITEDVGRYHLRVNEWHPVDLTKKREIDEATTAQKAEHFCKGTGRRAPIPRVRGRQRCTVCACPTMVLLNGTFKSHEPEKVK